MQSNSDLITLNIDLHEEQITESFLEMFGSTVKLILGRMFGSGGMIPAGTVTGTPSQISSFEQALAANKRYIDSYINHGLNNASTYRCKYQLQSAVKSFQRETGIQWPFK